MKKLLKYWLSPKIPNHYLQIKITGNGLLNDLKAIILFYFIHPVKRRIAKLYCVLLKNCFGLKVIAITGSSGKSTTKEMLASILKLKDNTIYSYANIDPVYNIPSTILRCSFNTKYLILELGVEYQDEMDFYLWMAKPDIGIITSINPTHTEFFKNIEGVYKEKIKLADYLIKHDKKVILNKENSYLEKYGSKNKDKVIFYGKGSFIDAFDVTTKDLKTSYSLKLKDEEIKINLEILGEINVKNSLAAIAVAQELAVDFEIIKKGLNKYKPLEHRLSLLKINNSLIIDDTYNNNPVAAKEAIKLFKELGDNKNMAVIFGDMLELGDLSKQYHQEIGEIFTKLPLKRIVCVGEESKVIYEIVKNKFGSNNSFWVSSQSEADKYVTDLLDKEFIILCKASRSIGLDNLITRLSK